MRLTRRALQFLEYRRWCDNYFSQKVERDINILSHLGVSSLCLKGSSHSTLLGRRERQTKNELILFSDQQCVWWHGDEHNFLRFLLSRSRIMFGRQPSKVVFLYKLTPLLLERWEEVWPSVSVFCSVFNITDAWFYKDIIAIYILLAVVVITLHY